MFGGGDFIVRLHDFVQLLKVTGHPESARATLAGDHKCHFHHNKYDGGKTVATFTAQF